MNEEDYHYFYAREMLFNLRSCGAISAETYLHWLDKVDKEQYD